MRYFLTFVLFYFIFSSQGQSAVLYEQISSHSQYYRFRVYLKDKGNTLFSFDNPESFLTGRAIERKKKEKVAIDESDLPISQDYFTLVEKAGAKVITYSKWFSTLVVEVPDSMWVTGIEALSFVDSVRYVWRGERATSDVMSRPRLSSLDRDPSLGKTSSSKHSRYGLTASQFSMHNALEMSEAGFRGEGMLVGVIDAGFTNFDVIPYFSSVKLGGYMNFVPGGDIFAASDHGTKVLSTMATHLPGVMEGSAPKATYWLLRSEDTVSEFPIEEDYWARAIEFADSLGVDIVNTSLGYNQFDDRALSYSHEMLDGNVSFMSQAADKAYDKGLLVVVSAGNEGNKPWRKITPPADAKNVLSIGAVGTDSVIASFSSHGLTADGRVKPDLVSVGRETVTIGRDGLVGTTNGTSLSSPFITGLIASLWSANPTLHRSELIDVVLRSSDRYANPDSIYGYGIPDFQIALKEVLAQLDAYPRSVKENGWQIHPDPSGDYMISLLDPIYSLSSYSLRLLDESGNLLSTYTFSEDNSLFVPLQSGVRNGNKYLYFVIEEPFKQRVYKVKI